jgi:hypothetical protein
MANNRQAVIISGLVLGALVAGLVWYQVIRQPKAPEVPFFEENDPLSPLTTPPTGMTELSPEPTASDETLPEETIPETTKGGLPLEEVVPEAVLPSAETGSGLAAIAALSLVSLLGLGLGQKLIREH